MLAIGIFIGLELFVMICLLAAIFRAADESRRLAFLGEMRYARANVDKVMKAARDEKAQEEKYTVGAISHEIKKTPTKRPKLS